MSRNDRTRRDAVTLLEVAVAQARGAMLMLGELHEHEMRNDGVNTFGRLQERAHQAVLELDQIRSAIDPRCR